MNNNLLLIAGKSATGKSMCLRNLKNQDKVIYLNCENNKGLPFRNKFKKFNITDPMQVFEAFDAISAGQLDAEVVVIDSVTYLMDMYETMYVINSTNSMQAWGQYAQYFKKLMQQYVANTKCKVIFTAHTSDIMNDSEMVMETMVKVKGSLMNQGIESYFSTVLSTKKMTLKKLKDYENSLLPISAEDEMLGFKHVFQTRITKDSVNERMRASMGMWEIKETFIDNDVQKVFDKLDWYYSEDE